jgi:Protein of unknown function (DUF3574)
MASGFGAGYALRPDRFAQSGLSCPAAARPFARLELLFGTQRKGAAPVSEEEWSQFLAAEITPRFPEGLTVFTGQGQWRGQDGINIKETSRMLLVWHSNEDDASSRIEAIRAAYKNRFGQESVLRADGESCVSF